MSPGGATLACMTPTAPDVVELTREEIVAQVERDARKRRGMSAATFVQAYHRGELAEPCEDADLLALAFLLPEDDPIFAGLRRA